MKKYLRNKSIIVTLMEKKCSHGELADYPLLPKTPVLFKHQGKHCWDRDPSASFPTLMIVPIYSNLENNFSTVTDQSSCFILIAKDQERWDTSQLFTQCSD